MNGSAGLALLDLMRLPHPDLNQIIQAFVPAYNAAHGDVSSHDWNVSKEEWYRFAFLGDRVLNLVVSQALYSRPGILLNKDQMTRILSSIVSNEALDAFLIRKKISVDALIPPQIDTQKKRGQRITGTAFEALVGALYCEIDLDEITVFLTSLFSEGIQQPDAANPKRTLKELFDTTGREWDHYVSIEKSGPQHEPLYRCTITWPDGRTFTGSGRKEKEAEREAAEAALREIGDGSS